MMRKLGILGIVVGALSIVVVIGGCPVSPPSSGPPGFVAADAKTGGQMYDKWWNVAGVDAAEPSADHPLWATRPDADSNSRTGPDTWRCKECHGWDYKGVDGAYSSGSHRTGFSGLLGTSLSAQEAFDKIKDGHGFGAAGLSDDDIWNLAKFVLTGLIDTDDVLDGDMFSGMADAGQAAYESTCLVCHGADGLAIPPGADADFDDFVGKIAIENPWEFQHKVRFGQPGTAMPPQFGILTDSQLADFGAYSQTLPTEPNPPGFVAADAKTGGQMYDKWWNVTGVDAAEPTEDHPLWATRPDMDSNSRTGADTWRCKECHGWDYKGVDGAYSSGSHRTGFSGLLGTSLSAQEAFDQIKDNHGFGAAGLSDDGIWNLARFVLTGLIDTDTIIDADGLFTGDVNTGQMLYDNGIGGDLACAVCHGGDGLTIDFGGGEFLGTLAEDNPWEFQHKVRFGNPGTQMPATVDVDATNDDVANVGVYSQTLPTAP